MVSSIYPSSNTVSLSRRGSRGKQVVVGDRFNFLARLLLSTKGMKGKKRLVRLLRLGNGMDRRWNDGNGTRMEANGPLDRPLIG